MKKRKGQFFIIGALVIIILMYTGLTLSEPIIKSPEADLGFFFNNINSEYPRALNFGLAENDVTVLQDFTRFLDDRMMRHYANLTALWVVLEGDGSTTVQVTAGNYLKKDTVVSVDLTGTPEELSVQHDSTNSTSIGGVSSTYTLVVSFGSVNETVSLERDKANLYVFYSLTRGEDLVKNEIIA